MDQQKIYSRVRKHLLKQGRPAHLPYGFEGECAYRTTDQDGKVLKCAIGCLIPFRLYTPELEGTSIDGLRVLTTVREALGDTIELDDVSLLQRLQSIHDRTEPEYWEAELNHLAAGLGLVPA